MDTSISSGIIYCMKNEPNCTFCKIVNRELLGCIIYEDDKYIAFLDINPQSPGHTQVIPKEHYRWVWDVPNVGEYFEVAKKIALAQRKAFNTNFILSKIMGDEVPHAHIWIFPNKEVEGNKIDFTENMLKITSALSAQ